MTDEHFQRYAEDIPELVRGRLDPARANEILRAAESDETLRRAIGSERELERLLEAYDIPEPSAALPGAFWARFHQARVMGDESVGARRAAWLLKLVGPLAAGVLIAVGVIAFYDNPGREPDNPGQTAEQTRPDNRSPVVTEPDDDWDDLGYLAEAHDRIDPARLDRLSANDLELLRKLDADAFLALDRIQQPEDLALVEDLELLRQIDRAEDRE